MGGNNHDCFLRYTAVKHEVRIPNYPQIPNWCPFEDKKSGWINKTKQLPEVNKRILIYDSYCNKARFARLVSNNLFEFESDGLTTGGLFLWMPEPEPPDIKKYCPQCGQEIYANKT